MVKETVRSGARYQETNKYPNNQFQSRQDKHGRTRKEKVARVDQDQKETEIN